MKKNITTCNRSKTSRAASGSSGPSHDGEMRPRDGAVKEGGDSGGRDGGDMGMAATRAMKTTCNRPKSGRAALGTSYQTNVTISILSICKGFIHIILDI